MGIAICIGEQPPPLKPQIEPQTFCELRIGEGRT
jgi:hypothetical protein